MQSVDNQEEEKTKEAQFFPLEAIKTSYTLRSPKSDKPTLVYMTVRYNNSLVKLSTCVKVYPSQWERESRKAVVSNKLFISDNRNNEIVNERLKECDNVINEVMYYLCNNPNEMDKGLGLIKEKLYKDRMMKTQKKKEGYEGGTKATFELMRLVERDTKLTPISKENKLRELKFFGIWLAENNIADTWHNISKLTLRDYEHYLINVKKKKANTLQTKFAHIVSSINEAVNLEIYPNNINIGIQNYKIQKAKKTTLPKSFSLENEEVDLIYNVEGLTKKEELYKDLFVLQCEMGQRVSDMQKIVDNDYVISDDGKYIRLQQQKTKTYVSIPLNSRISEILEKNKGKWEFIKLRLKEKLNTTIKGIAEKAKLTRLHTFEEEVEGKLIIVTKPLHEIITTHIARHTFITLRLRGGWSKDSVKIVSGHTDDAMIDKVYSHLTIEDKETKLTKQINTTKVVHEAVNNYDAKVVHEVKEVLTLFGVPPIQWINLNDLHELYRLVFEEEKILEEIGFSKQLITDIRKLDKLEDKYQILNQIKNHYNSVHNDISKLKRKRKKN